MRDANRFPNGPNVVDSYASHGNLNARYITPGSDENLSMTRGANTYYYMADRLGSIRNVLESNEDVANTYDYYAFGNTLGTPTTGVTSPYEYTAREFEDGGVNTTLYYRNRYYMSALGIFTSRDAMWADVHRGWGYVDNLPTMWFDPYGLSELSASDYRKFIESLLKAGYTEMDYLWRETLNHYLEHDPEDDLFWDAEDDMEEIFEAFYDIFSDLKSPWHHSQGITVGCTKDADGSNLTHYFAGAAWQATANNGEMMQDLFEHFPQNRWWLPQSPVGDWKYDTAYAYGGVDAAEYFDTWLDSTARERIKEFTSGRKRFSAFFGFRAGMPLDDE